MNNLFQNKKILLNLILSIATILIGLYVLIFPMKNYLIKLYYQNKDKDAQIAQLDTESADLQKISNDMKQNPKKYENVMNYLPKKNADNSAKYFEQLSAATSVNMTKLSYTDQGKGQATGILNVPQTTEKVVKLTLQSNYQSLQSFLSGVLNLPQFIYINKINITANAETADLAVTIDAQVIIGGGSANQ